jgi:integrase/recombinase XerC
LTGWSARASFRPTRRRDRRAENAASSAKNIDVDDVNRLLDIDLNDPLAVRDRAMLEVMYGAGLRLSELVNLDIKHLDLETGEVWVMGKGSKERRLPIGRNAVSGLSTGWICAGCLARRRCAVFVETGQTYFRA